MRFPLNLPSINWNEILSTITWTEAILPGFFTLLGSALGAFLAGKYAVRAVTSQLNYDKYNKRLDILDTDLKISNEFTIRLKILISEIIEEEKIFLQNNSTKESENLDIKISYLKELESYSKEIHGYLSVLQINNIPFDDYRRYRDALLSVNQLNLILTNLKFNHQIKEHKLKSLKKYGEEKIKKIENDIEKNYLEFEKTREELIKHQEEIQKQYLVSKKEYKLLKKEIHKITKN